MVYYKSAIIFMGIGILLCSCVRQTKNSAGNDWIDIQAKFSSDRFISSVIDSVSYVGLGTDEKSLIRDIDKITKSGADFIISDYRRGQIVVLDEQSGRCRFTINRIGQGPEEYLEIRACCADDSAIYIVDNSRARMMQFRLSDGVFVRSVAMPVTADDMEVLPGGGFIFACVPTGGQRKLLPSRHRLFMTDKDLNVVRSLFQYDEGDQDPIGQRFYLTRNGSEIVFGSLMSSGFSILSGDNLSQIRKTNMIFDRPVNKNTGFNDLKEYQYLTLPPYSAGKYYYIIFHDGKGRQKYGIWDSAENILMTNDRTEGKTMGQIIGSYGNNMIGLIRSKELYDELVEHGFPRVSVYIEHLLENDDYALIIYHLK